jgi:hypothetical protein
MNKILIACLAFLVALPAYAANPFYVDAGTGIAFNSNQVVTHNPTVVGKLGIGYDFDKLRFAVEYNNLNIGNGSVKANVIGLQGYAEPFKFPVGSITLVPYVTGGAGYAFYSGSGYSDGNGGSGSGSEAIFNMGAGLTAKFTPQWSAYVEARQYLGFGSHVYRDNGGLTNFSTRTVLIGARFSW